MRKDKCTEFFFSKPIDEELAADRIVTVIGKEGFQRRRNSHVLLIGAGHLGSKVGTAIAKMGYNFTVIDPDIVGPENIVLQEFDIEDIGTPKAIALARRAALLSPFPILGRGIPLRFDQAIKAGLLTYQDFHAVIAVPDNDLARLEVAYYFHDKLPVIFAGISEDSNYAYVFVQECGNACLRCVFPNMKPTPRTGGCRGHMAEMGFIATGYIAFALDSLFLGDHPLRKRSWNLCKVYLNGLSDLRKLVAKRTNCDLCSQPRQKMQEIGGEERWK